MKSSICCMCGKNIHGTSYNIEGSDYYFCTKCSGKEADIRRAILSNSNDLDAICSKYRKKTNNSIYFDEAIDYMVKYLKHKEEIRRITDNEHHLQEIQKITNALNSSNGLSFGNGTSFLDPHWTLFSNGFSWNNVFFKFEDVRNFSISNNETMGRKKILMNTPIGPLTLFVSPNDFQKFNAVFNVLSQINTLSKNKEIKIANNKSEFLRLTNNVNYGDMLYFNDEFQKFAVAKYSKMTNPEISNFIPYLYDFDIYNYADIISHEILQEQMEVSTGGLGTAIAGGILFGAAGAVVGSNVGPKISQSVPKSLYIKLTMNNNRQPSVIINVLDFLGQQYSSLDRLMDLLHELSSKFELICKSNSSTHQNIQSGQLNFSVADELKKFKELLDAHVITQEEFDVKKRQLLS